MSDQKVQIKKSDLIKMRQEDGKTINWIANHYGVAPEQIKRAVKACNLPPRVSKVNKFDLVDDTADNTVAITTTEVTA
jgi:transposase-like protein